MQSKSSALNRLSNAELVSEVHRLAGDERQATSALLEALAELDERQLYLDEGCSSLFAYCRDVLGYSEDEACARMRVARAARRFPLLIEMIGESRLTLTAARLLVPHLTDDNHREVLREASGKTKEHVELIVARLNPKPDVKPMVRKLTEPASPRAAASTADDRSRAMLENATATAGVGSSQAGGPATPSPAAAAAAATGNNVHSNEVCQVMLATTHAPRERAVVAPLSPERYKLQMTISGQTRAKLKRAQDLLRHAVPSGDLAEIFDRALTLLIAHAEKQKCAATDRPRENGENAAAPDKAAERIKGRKRTGQSSQSRHIPAAVKRAVWLRDEGRCAHVGAQGRCRETAFLEYHHRVPFCAGGTPTVDNLALFCRRHNNREAVKYEEMLIGGPPDEQGGGYPFRNG